METYNFRLYKDVVPIVFIRRENCILLVWWSYWINDWLLSMYSSLLSVWRLNSVIKRTTALKDSPQYKTCPSRLDLPGPDHSGACSGCGRRTLTVSRSISRTFIPGPLFSIILVTYCFTASVTFMVATQKVNDKKRSRESRQQRRSSGENQLSWCYENIAARLLPGLWRHMCVRVTRSSRYRFQLF